MATRSVSRFTSRLSSVTSKVLLGALVFATAVPGLVACRSAAPGGETAAAPRDIEVVPAPPARTPFVPPTWEAKKYTNEEHRFSVHYPADFEEQPAQDGALFTAASPMQAPRLDITTGPLPSGGLDAMAAVLEQSFAALGGGEAKVTDKKETRLRDDVTPASELTLEWAFQGFPLQSSVVAVERDGVLISVTVTGMQGTDISELSDIAYTLYFDD